MCNVENLVKVSERIRSNLNFGFVTLDGDRVCEHCGAILPKGTDCIKFYRKSKEGRKLSIYTCDACYELQWGIVNAKRLLDKYMTIACQDILAEVVEEYESKDYRRVGCKG